MAVRVRDLIDQIGTPGPHPVLHCNICGQDNSANKGDYFMLPDDHVFVCCESEMQLAMKKTVYKPVKLPQEKP